MESIAEHMCETGFVINNYKKRYIEFLSNMMHDIIAVNGKSSAVYALLMDDF